MSTVFFLYLGHFALGLLATLFLVPERAGPRFFKLCSAIAAAMLTASVYVALRRYGLHGGANAPGGPLYPAVLASAGASLLFCVLYNRAAHFAWRALATPLLSASLAAGIAGVLVGTPQDQRVLVAVTDLSSLLLLGAAAAAMILGHFYLVVVDLPIVALRRLTILLIAALGLRTLVVAFALLGPLAAGLEDARRVALGLWSPDGVFVWMRVLFGIVGPASLLWF
ncbi:MAG TPA: hypothetical protein VFM88_10595, partial [Vicinamibacteria bacterium]|nr:hypothetical protein [Vicinamibacteria bacterium]